MPSHPQDGRLPPRAGIAGDTWREGLALAGFAVAIQAAFLLDTAASPVFRYPLVDAVAYYQQARAMLAGIGTAGAFWQPPAYPCWLALLGRVAGMDVPVLRAVQALLLAPLAALLLWRVARRFLPLAWALTVGLVLCVTGPFLFYCSQLLPAVPAAVLFTAVLWLAMRAWERPSVWHWFAAGAVTGLATLFVATCGALLPVLAVCAWCGSKPQMGRRIRFAVAPLAGLLLVLTPVALRNYEACGRWVWISTNGGANLFVGNNRNWDVTLTAQPGLDWDKLMRLPYLQHGVTNAVDADRQFRRMAVQDARRDPAACVRRLARKAAMFWHGREIPRNLDIYGWRDQSVLLRLAVWRAGVAFPTGVLVPLAAVGALALRRRRDGLTLVAGVVAFGLLVALYFPCSRYRVPVLPALVLLACVGAHAGCVAVQARRWRVVAGCVALALAAGVAANWPVIWPTDTIRYDAHLWNAIGAAADGRQDMAFAKTCYETALRLDPLFADAQFNLGTVFARQKDGARAEACYQAAVAARPDHDQAHINLALHLAERGQTEDALRHLVLAETFNPLNADAFRNHAAILLRAGRNQEARAPLTRAAVLDPTLRKEQQSLERALQSNPAR